MPEVEESRSSVLSARPSSCVGRECSRAVQFRRDRKLSGQDERVANKIASLIDRGTLRRGDRLPSVRDCSRQEKVSVATVPQAYLSLESQGLIEVRPKSGH